ncbi:hypothetical protein E2C01_049434 [Portunus trituberculatus]|uniref:Uncharacterized protein n=1 Tax=Portunus trituberculatus TaxID=210409 RepID=A0A5B7GD54_PORTR|nr:hypothetical protein [Portunus trituberculatus]
MIRVNVEALTSRLRQTASSRDKASSGPAVVLGMRRSWWRSTHLHYSQQRPVKRSQLPQLLLIEVEIKVRVF